MSRRISVASVVGTLGGSKGVSTGGATPAASNAGDDYLGRLLKYIPAELIGLYLAARGVVPATERNIDRILWIVAAMTWLLVPIYLYFATSRNRQTALWWQIVLGTLAFPVWLFAIGGR